ncbi:hypothetical protein [Streptomyces marincola]|uniref:hypothetical protein n=1 Tax=Streptomyces marincola TaxID=2878388 RepID=UPI001CF3FA0D|nr:hypothetical protein [Streptomyces marincola]UCM88022.1 hypothetical protein LC193_08670 [Streptomyces marincola]
MASRNDTAVQERRSRLRERQENERKEFRRRQQAQLAALNDIDTALERLRQAEAAVACAVAHGVTVFGSVDALAEMTPFDAKDVRAHQRRHRRTAQVEQAAPAPNGIGAGTAARS